MAFEGLTLKKQKVHPTPPRGSVPAGTTTHRVPKQVYKRKAHRFHTELAKKIDPVTGEVERNRFTGQEEYDWILNERGQKLYRRRRLVPKDSPEGHKLGLVKDGVSEGVVQFYYEDQGNGNARKVRYNPPPPEEIARRQRRERAKDLLPALLDELAAEGLTAQEIVARLKDKEVASQEQSVSARGQEDVINSDPEPEPDWDAEPEMYAPGRWRMIDGSTFQGKKEDAVKANALIAQRVKEVRDTEVLEVE